MLTDEQRAEGTRLLAIAQTLTRSEITETYAPFDDWLRLHAPELLAEPAAIDVEAIKREAVREFAGWVIAEFSQSHYRQATSERITELAAEHNIEIVEP